MFFLTIVILFFNFILYIFYIYYSKLTVYTENFMQYKNLQLITLSVIQSTFTNFLTTLEPSHWAPFKRHVDLEKVSHLIYVITRKF